MLNIMKDNQSITDITVSILSELERINIQEKPHVVLMHGNTTTAMATALVTFYPKIPVVILRLK